ncbi:AfsR/SARP family transcriptional regulator [Micromonospora okii]|uniref:AfsR/SARP family transcriptional regulator n=1 Tax=Micromonospora okii TaxID=1182970 RepID=UPI001E4AB43D|nr:AfsR/SARP family transcriptional regulator [Micromonospora okii]
MDAVVGGPKSRAFLAMLALNANEAVSLRRLTEALWEGSPPPSATANLRNYAARLRTALRLIGAEHADRLVAGNGRYQLAVGDHELDVHRFDTLAAEGRGAVRRLDWVTGERLLRRARTLWRGDAAEDVPRSTMLDSYLVALDERRLTVEEDHLEALVALGDHGTAIERLRRFLGGQPYRERAWRLLMLARYRAGDVIGALAAYDEVRRVFADGFGIDPDVSLARLRQVMLRRDPWLAGNDVLRAQPGRDDPFGEEALDVSR